jgi:hypothetical protein
MADIHERGANISDEEIRNKIIEFSEEAYKQIVKQQ